jgi:hypothetical protein
VPLQIGTWLINVGGLGVGNLVIAGVDAQGNVSATLGPSGRLSGFWDEDAQKLTLTLFPVNTQIPTVVQIFVGYLFTDPVNLLGVTGSVFFTLAGHVENFIPMGGAIFRLGPPATAKRSVFGWYAQIGVD